MSNTLLTINMITREAVRLWVNTNSFLQHIDTQYDDQFAITGAKIGQSLRIRLPNDYTVRTGPVAQIQDTAETNTTLTLATQKGVDVSFNSAERTMSLDDYSKRVLAPAVNNLVGAVAADIMSGVEGGVSNLVGNFDSAGNLLKPTLETWLNAKALLSLRSAPTDNRKFILDPVSMARTVQNLSGLLNPATEISEQYRSGEVYNAIGFDWFEDQTVIKHTTGTYVPGTSPTVSGANQTGTAINVTIGASSFTVGDIITFAGVNAVNRITKVSTGDLQQFVVTGYSGGVLNIYPAIVPPNGTAPVQYQTVTASPANGAAINSLTLSGSIYRKNIAFIPDAVTMATADLEMPKNMQEVARERMDGVSLRMVTGFDIKSDQFITRLDVLYGYVWVRPEWAVVVADII
jgi:P22 coat protein - gene protein 5